MSYYKAETKFEGGYSRQVFSEIAKIYKPYTLLLVVFLCVGLIGRFLVLSSAFVFARGIDDLIATGQFTTFSSPETGLNAGWFDLIVKLFVIGISGFVCSFIFRAGVSRTSSIAVSQFHDLVFNRVAHAHTAYFDRTPVGRIVTRFSSDYGAIFRLFGGPLGEFIGICFDLVSAIVMMILIYPKFIFVEVFFGTAIFLQYRSRLGSIREKRRSAARSRSPSISHFAESVQGASTIRASGRELSFSKRFNDHYLVNIIDKQILFKEMILFSIRNQAIMLVFYGTVGIVGLQAVQLGLLGYATLASGFVYIFLSTQSLQFFMEWLTEFEEGLTGVERMVELLGLDVEERAPPISFLSSEEKTKSSKGVGLLDVKSVSFAYDKRQIINSVSFRVESGEHLGIVGRTGCGKSTLMNLIQGMYPLSSGIISVDSMYSPEMTGAGNGKLDVSDLSDLSAKTGVTGVSIEQFRSNFSVISQVPFIFHATIRENLALGCLKTDQDLIYALNEVGLRSWFEKAGLGLETLLEERGRNLSEGEKQLICLARCLLRDRPVLLFDEATSHIDPTTEKRIEEVVFSTYKNRTRLTIAHRLTTVSRTDRILWLEDGSIKRLDQPKSILRDFTRAHESLSNH